MIPELHVITEILINCIIIDKAKGFEATNLNGVQEGMQANGSIHGLWEFFHSTGKELVEAIIPWLYELCCNPVHLQCNSQSQVAHSFNWFYSCGTPIGKPGMEPLAFTPPELSVSTEMDSVD